jgi:hypothetical protein
MDIPRSYSPPTSPVGRTSPVVTRSAPAKSIWGPGSSYI